MSSQRINSLKYDYEKDIAVSYYFVDRKKVWIRSPIPTRFIVEDPYTGDDRFATSSYNEVFKIPFLKEVGTTLETKNNLLVACLWLKDHKLYSDHLVKTGTEFYRCLLTNNEDTNWILIPLYSKLHANQVRNPVLLYHELNFTKTLIMKDPYVYYYLMNAFFDFKYKGYINRFSILINGKMKWMIQFAGDAPACFLL